MADPRTGQGEGQQFRPWLRKQDRAAIRNYRLRYPSVIANRVFVKDNGRGSWIECEYPGKRFSFDLLRQVDNPLQDWLELTLLALMTSGLARPQRTKVLRTVALCAEAQGRITLKITPKGFVFKDCLARGPVTLAEGTF